MSASSSHIALATTTISCDLRLDASIPIEFIELQDTELATFAKDKASLPQGLEDEAPPLDVSAGMTPQRHTTMQLAIIINMLYVCLSSLLSLRS